MRRRCTLSGSSLAFSDPPSYPVKPGHQPSSTRIASVPQMLWLADGVSHCLHCSRSLTQYFTGNMGLVSSSPSFDVFNMYFRGGATFAIMVSLYEGLRNQGLSQHVAWRAAFAIVPLVFYACCSSSFQLIHNLQGPCPHSCGCPDSHFWKRSPSRKVVRTPQPPGDCACRPTRSSSTPRRRREEKPARERLR